MAFCAPVPYLYLFGNLVTCYVPQRRTGSVSAIQWCAATLVATVFCAVSGRVHHL